MEEGWNGGGQEWRSCIVKVYLHQVTSSMACLAGEAS